MPEKQRVVILGSTGSIGTAALEVIRDFRERFEVVGLSARRNTDLLVRQIEEFSPRAVCVADPGEAEKSAESLGAALRGRELLTGEEGLTALVERYDADVLVAATVGFAGLFPTIKGIERGMRIALANKEVLVVAGEIVMARAREAGVEILPIDSEHNAIFHCLAGNDRRSVRRIVLTASGGPFLGMSREELRAATPEQALNLPTWNMGRKITIDSATLMNKGLEVIEACHLFDVRPEQVEVVIHPQSTIHSMVEFADGSILAQLGQTNMYLPILNILTHPERLANKFEPLDLAALGRLEFARPDRELFPCLDYAYEAIEAGGALPAVMNAANEVAVQAFLDGKRDFMGIAATVREAMDQHLKNQAGAPESAPTLESLRLADRSARVMAEKYGNIRT